MTDRSIWDLLMEIYDLDEEAAISWLTTPQADLMNEIPVVDLAQGKEGRIRTLLEARLYDDQP